MAFSMKQIKSNRKQTNVYTPDLFGWSHNLTNISDNAKNAIRLYLDARLYVFGSSGLTYEGYKYMIKDLLKNCCGNEFIYLTPVDTDLNIDEIVFQLKWALKRHRKDKRTLYKHTLYVNPDKEMNLRKYVDNNVPSRKEFSKSLSAEDLEKYFGEERWR